MRAAFVRSRVSSNGAGERLYRALADKEDTTVDQLHEHLTEEFPFEHNTWSGGVKADDISVNNEAHRSDDEADPDTCSEREDGEAGIEGGLDSGADSPSRGGQSSVRPGAVPISGRNTSAGVGQLVPLLEGYMGRIKEHITAEFGSIRTEVAATTSSVAALESFVKTEFARLKDSLSNCDPMFTGDPFAAFSPHRNEAPAGATSVDRQHDHGDSFPISTRNDGTQSDALPLIRVHSMSVLSFHFIRNPHSSCDEVSLVSCEGTNGTFICYFLQLADPMTSPTAANIVTPTKVVGCRPEWYSRGGPSQPTQFVSKLQGFARSDKSQEDTISERPMDMDESQHRETTPLSQSIAPLPSYPPPIASEIYVPITISPSVSTPAQSDPVGEETVIVPEEMY
ncbi:hypothetical protein Bca52824_090174 [Brassica carinata]|uniref:Uncharacterized protein n=1 Tax=Brassica carinata TaxID=52824 RepID=A0A8X7NSL3_BRACI|nr:hypothetical protein Bca52824_090174 [Brassica carinata]